MPEQNIYDLGFNKGLNRSSQSIQSPTVYDILDGAIDTGNISPSGNLVLSSLDVAGFTRQVGSGSELQDAINALSRGNGGVVHLRAGTFNLETNITVPSNITLEGEGAATIIDFGGGPYQFQVVGSDNYSTGTVSITRDTTTVTGAGGAAFTQAMVGRFILLQEFWYEITAVTDSTHLTIGVNFSGTTLSGATYVLANIISGVSFRNFVVQNSSIALIKDQYTDASVYSGLIFDDGLVAMDCDDSSGLFIDTAYILNCGTGITQNNTEFSYLYNTTCVNITSGGGVSWTDVHNSAIQVFTVQNCIGNGLTLTDCGNIGMSISSLKEITGKGIECVSTVRDFGIENILVAFCSSDGIKLTATTDGCQIIGSQINNNTGFGVNIAASTCDNNVISGNTFENNTAGAVSNSGTGTVIRGNAGVADSGGTLDTEAVSDHVGTMVTGNTETGITVTYQDADNTLDFVVSDTTFAGDTGSIVATPGETVTIAGGTGLTTSVSANTLTVNGDTASTTVVGVVEIATAAEINTGTDTGRAVAPDFLAGSNFGIRYVQGIVFEFGSSVTTGDGKFYFEIPPGLGGMNLVSVHAKVITAGTTNSTTIQIHNLTQAADMLSALLEVETGETSSRTSAPGPTIDTANDDVADGDIIRIDVDTVSTTPPKGLIINCGFQLP